MIRHIRISKIFSTATLAGRAATEAAAESTAVTHFNTAVANAPNAYNLTIAPEQQQHDQDVQQAESDYAAGHAPANSEYQADEQRPTVS